MNETSNPFMKFADSIRQAEKLTGGDPDMVDDEKFQPKKSVPAQSKYTWKIFFRESVQKLLL